jgi:uncharacterized protein YndB with AHSA1/START domain
MVPTSHIDVHVSHHFNAPPEQVFDAWLVPREMGRWMFGAHIHDVRLLRLDVDPRVGGRFSLQVRRSGQSIDHIGHYLELERPRRLAMTWAVKGAPDDACSRVQIDLAPSGAGSVLILTHRMDAKWAGNVHQVRGDWSAMLDALGELFA